MRQQCGAFFGVAAQYQRAVIRQRHRAGHMPVRQRVFADQLERIETKWRHGQQIGQPADRRETATADDVHRHAAFELGQVQLHRLQGVREVGHAQHGFVLIAAQVGQHAAVAWVQKAQRAAAERLVALAHAEHAAGPRQQRMLVADLRFHVHRLEAVQRVHDRRQHQCSRVGTREATVAVDRPLHRGAHTIAVAQMDVVAHADLIAVVQHRRAGHGQQQGGHQFDAAAVALQQRRQAAADA